MYSGLHDSIALLATQACDKCVGRYMSAIIEIMMPVFSSLRKKSRFTKIAINRNSSRKSAQFLFPKNHGCISIHPMLMIFKLVLLVHSIPAGKI